VIGQRIGSYSVVEKLGEGGMGEVYRAHDARLGRDVAIKVMLDAFLADRDRLARFEREARALAALNHPNVATLHGMEEADGRHFLVMELVEGRTLSEVLASRPERGADGLPIAQAVDVARQIAEALEAAHEKGIVHRDLKPANVKITPDDKVKVLDFGLAMIGSGPSGAAEATADVMSNSPTITAMGTQAGMILGTASYMSPEQARGASGDHRSDVFSFGVVLFEMLTGRQPFQGDTVSDVLASVLAREPDLAALPQDLPPRLTHLIRRCLDKHPKRRWQAMGDVRYELDEIAKDPTAPAQAAPVLAAPLPLWRRALAPAGGLLLGAVATAVAAQAVRPAPVAPEPIAFEITSPIGAPVMSLSPDGRQVIFGSMAADNEPAKLWMRPIGSLEARPIPGTEGAFVRRGQWLGQVAWSPNSDSIAYVGSGFNLNRLDLITGQVRELVKVPGYSIIPGAWNRDGVILYGQRSAIDARSGGIYRIADASGSPAQLTELTSNDLMHRPSGFLPDGRRFLYRVTLMANAGGASEIRLGSIDRKPSEQDTTALMVADGPAVYAPPGYLIFVRGGNLMAQAFDADRGVLTASQPLHIASGISPALSVSDNGRLLYRAIGGADAAPQTQITRFDRAGKILGTVGPPAIYGDINTLADGMRLSIIKSEAGDNGHIHIVDPARPVFTRLNPGEPFDFAVAVAPDNLLAFTYSPDGISRDIHLRHASGVGDLRPLVKSPYVKHPNSWTPDGRFLVYDEHVPGRSQDLMMVRREGGSPVTLMATDFDETFAMVSPSGRWLAYRTTESGDPEVWVRDFNPDRTPVFGSEKIQISMDGGDKPRWSRDGSELFFFNGEALMAASVRPDGSTLKVGIPTKLFDVRHTNYIPYDVLKDGTFVVNAVNDGGKPASPTPMRVLMNWETAIKK
jgi:tRNA A-37 threonylcarbamoyl transferase component Bud32/Tol biopolymer transport system component